MDLNQHETSNTSTNARKRRPQTTLRRLLVITVASASAFYVGACLVIFLLQARLIYFPEQEYRVTPADVGLEYQDLTLTTADGVTLAAWYVPHAESKATILFCHGNAGNIADRCQTLNAFHRLGYSVLIFDYRGYGRSAGAPSEAGTYRDAEAAWRHLTEQRGIPAREVILFGRSLGGAVAIELARRHSPAALVVESTFDSLVEIGKQQYPFLPVGLLCRHRYDSVQRIPRVSCPKLFLHGTDDTLIPINNARRLFAAAAGPKTFMETPGGHDNAGFEYNTETTRKFKDWLATVVAR